MSADRSKQALADLKEELSWIQDNSRTIAGQLEWLTKEAESSEIDFLQGSLSTSSAGP